MPRQSIPPLPKPKREHSILGEILATVNVARHANYGHFGFHVLMTRILLSTSFWIASRSLFCVLGHKNTLRNGRGVRYST